MMAYVGPEAPYSLLLTLTAISHERLAQYGCVLILVLRMKLLGLFFVTAGVLLWAASVFGRIRTTRVPRVRAHYRHPHAPPLVGDLAKAHSRRAFARPLRLAVRSGPLQSQHSALPAETEATQTLTMTSASRSPFHCSVRVLVC